MMKHPNPIDRHVGARLKMRRKLVKMSQGKLGDALGVTFQQVQKYEKGSNRIGASRLQQIARVLNVPPAYFFDGAPGSEGTNLAAAESERSAFVVDFLSTNEGLQLNRAFARIVDVKIRKHIIDLVSSLADSQRLS